LKTRTPPGKKPELDMTFTHGRVSNITDQHFSPHRKKKYPPNPKTLRISAIFLLECKKWVWHLTEIALNDNLLKFNEMSDFNKSNVKLHSHGQ
jgi:hypothetical protein